jgi:uncharacterized damage-inducible protein DinB
MKPETAGILRDDAIEAFKAERGATIRVIEAIPAEKADYRPEPFVKSALELAWHIVAAEHMFINATLNGAFDFSRRERPSAVQTPADIARWYANTLDRDLAQLATAPTENLVTPVDFRGIMTWPAVAFLRVGIHHTIHHRGQLSMYLRPMGAKVPAIYGESYDTAQAKAAAVASNQ